MNDFLFDEDKQILEKAEKQITLEAKKHLHKHLECPSSLIKSRRRNIVQKFIPALEEIEWIADGFSCLKKALEDLPISHMTPVSSSTHVNSIQSTHKLPNTSSHTHTISPKSHAHSALLTATTPNQRMTQNISMSTRSVMAVNVSSASSSTCSSLSKKRKLSAEIQSNEITTPPSKAKKLCDQNEGVTYELRKGRILQSNIVAGLKVLALGTEVWSRATVTKVTPEPESNLSVYEVRFDASGLCQVLRCHQLACLDTCKLFSNENPIFYGARIACRYNDNKLYSGIVAQEASESTQYRVLVFFDDGHAMYASQSDVYLVFGLQTTPWIQVKNSLCSNFIREFLNIKTLHMLKLKKGEIIEVSEIILDSFLNCFINS